MKVILNLVSYGYFNDYWYIKLYIYMILIVCVKLNRCILKGFNFLRCGYV